MEKTLISKCMTRKSHTIWTLNLKIRGICLYNLYNKFKVHVVWLDFLQVRVNYFDIRGFFTSFLMNASIIEPRTKKNYEFNDGCFQKELFNCKDNWFFCTLRLLISAWLGRIVRTRSSSSTISQQWTGRNTIQILFGCFKLCM